MLRRLERNALACCLAAAAVTLILRGGRGDVSAAVLAGGFLVAVSYWAIKSSIDAMAAVVRPAREPATGEDSRDESSSPRGVGIMKTVAKFGVRYALLGFLAYVMIARLHLHPVGLLVGASSLVMATAIEAIRFVEPRGTHL